MLRILVFTGRDMLIGFLLGLSVMILIYKLNPRFPGAGFLVLLGLLTGIVKGLAKGFLLSKLDTLAHGEFRRTYPKFKILGLWFIVLFIVLIYSYGFNLARWFIGPLEIMTEKSLIINMAGPWWVVLSIAVLIAGLVSHFTEPPGYK
jgi:hypothetical protein